MTKPVTSPQDWRKTTIADANHRTKLSAEEMPGAPRHASPAVDGVELVDQMADSLPVLQDPSFKKS